MNGHVVCRLTGALVGIVAILLVAPCLLGVVDGQPQTAFAYGLAAALALALAAVLRWIGRRATDEVHRKDAFGVVAFTWLVLGLLGGLPFVVEGSITDPAGALFEAVSGFTTTGATVVGEVDDLTRATNLWRCLMHWIGGMGIVVLFVAVFPQLGVGAKHLFRSEVPGPITSGLRPKIRQTATYLWWIYGSLTAICLALLKATGMPLYDATCHAMSTLATGGFSTRTASVGYYDDPVAEWIIAAFMLIGGLNFGLYYDALRGRWQSLFRNAELRFFLAINLAVIALVTVTTLAMHEGVLETIRYAAFQVLAVTTTTGFMTEDYDKYPDVARFALFLCMFMGGCAGSTAGGLKASRVFILWTTAFRELGTLVRPNVVAPVRAGRGVIAPHVMYGILIFFAAYMLLFSAVSFALVAMNEDLITAMSATAACLSSVGPGLGEVGPAKNFGNIPAAGKLLLSMCMIAGRLEIYALFAVLSPECWRR